ncbi:MAG: type II toxin-antitoxin system VapC family toxin [Gaiella sp.]
MGRGEGSPLIVLDTHAWLWWQIGSGELSKPAAAEIGRADEIGVSAMTCWELTMLERRGKIRFERGASAWVRQALADDRTTLLPITDRIAVRAGQLHPAIAEPADALIFATAVEHRAPLVTRDRLLRQHDPSRTIW